MQSRVSVPLPGTLVWIRQRRWRVERARLDRHVLRLDVANRQTRLTFLAPFDRPAVSARTGGVRHVRRQRAAAQLAAAIARLPTARGLDVAIDAKIELLPHQLEPALALAHGARRILLADSVGAGKTIQAGLAIADLIRREPAARVLIAVPSALRDQWLDELQTRFDINAAIADRAGLDQAARTGAFGDDPWRQARVWIASLDFVKQPHVLDAMPLLPWDLLVVDEAHDACGVSERHRACDAIARRARQVLLMTATPHSGDALRFRRLLALGAHEHVADTLTMFRRTRSDIGRTTRRRVAWRRIAAGQAARQLFAALRAFEAAVLRQAGERRDAALLFLAVLRKRATSTMAAFEQTVERRLRYLDDPTSIFDADWAQQRLDFEDLTDDIDAADRLALFARIGLDTTQERTWLRRLRQLVADAVHDDRKIACVVRLVRRTPEPVVVFTEFRHSLAALAMAVERHRKIAVLHGGQTVAERQAELRKFLDGTASALLATDVASQGLNLQQRARWVVSLELPWNPLRLEQRIGRVDRLGQSRAVHATLLRFDDEMEDGLLARLARRALIADRAIEDDAAVPEEGALATALLLQAPLSDVAPVPAVPVCSQWTRQARALVRSLARRRALANRWRAAGGPITGRAIAGRLPLDRYTASGSLVVLAVPLVDDRGDVVEQRAVVLRVSAKALSLDALSDAAAARVRPRARRLGRLRAQIDAVRLMTSCAIAAHLHAIGCPEEAQPGLFDARVQEAIARATVLAAEIGCDLENQQDTERSELTAGRATLLFDGRRS